jgi:hypothetical protein
MMGPSWVPGTFAGIMIVVAVVSAARLAAAAAARQWLAADADADAAHLLMAIAMAGMLTTSLKTLPAGVWEPVFGVLTAWFAVRVARESAGPGVERPRAWATSCHAPHLVHSVAMLYMFLALRTATSGAGMGGMSGATGQVLALPTLALVLALLLAGYTVRDLDLAGPAGPRPGRRSGWEWPRRGVRRGVHGPMATVQEEQSRGRACRLRGPNPRGNGHRDGGMAARLLPHRDGGHHGLHADHHDLAHSRCGTCLPDGRQEVSSRTEGHGRSCHGYRRSKLRPAARGRSSFACRA